MKNINNFATAVLIDMITRDQIAMNVAVAVGTLMVDLVGVVVVMDVHMGLETDRD